MRHPVYIFDIYTVLFDFYLYVYCFVCSLIVPSRVLKGQIMCDEFRLIGIDPITSLSSFIVREYKSSFKVRIRSIDKVHTRFEYFFFWLYKRFLCVDMVSLFFSLAYSSFVNYFNMILHSLYLYFFFFFFSILFLF